MVKNKQKYLVAIGIIIFFAIFNLYFFSVKAYAMVGTEGTQVNENALPEKIDNVTRFSKFKNDRENVNRDIKDLKNKRKDLRDKAKKAILDKVKKIANKAIDRAVTKLENVKRRISKIKAISEGLKKEINQKIDTRIARLKAKKNEVDVATTVEEVKSVLKEVREEIKDAHDIIKDQVEAIRKTQLKRLVKKLDSILEKIKNKLKNPSEKIQNLIKDAKSFLSQADNYANSGEYKKAKENLRLAHQKIGQIISNLQSKYKVRQEGNNGQ